VACLTFGAPRAHPLRALFKGSDDISGFINDFYKKGIDLKFTRQEHEGTVVT
jgi:hypothetical protein